MEPEEHSQESFEWEGSLRYARDEFKARSPEAASALSRALADSAQMAEHCHEKLLKQGPTPPSGDTFADWEDFLFKLYSDTWKVYLRHRDLVERAEGDLQTRLVGVRDAAQDALIDLQDLKERRLERAVVVSKLRRLVEELEAVQTKLGPRLKAQGIPRAYDISTETVSQDAVHVPVLGPIAAGQPIVVEELTEDIFPLPRQLVGKGKLFVLRVVGESMLDAGILDRDWIVIRQQPVAENGEIVAVRIDEAVTVKTWMRSGDQVWLVSHNQLHERIRGDRAEILGKVVAVLRRV